MTLDYSVFAAASTLMHVAQGAALLLLGAAEVYALDNGGGKAAYAGPLALLAAAAAMPLIMAWQLGAWDLDRLRLALDLRRGFLLFFAFACLFGAAGLSRLTQLATGKDAGGWRTMFLGFLSLSGVLYFMLSSRVNAEASGPVLVWHAAAGATLLAAVALKAAHGFSARRWTHIAWAVFLMMAGLQLATYKEPPETFGLRMVTMSAGPQQSEPVKKNAGTPDKERPAGRR